MALSIKNRETERLARELAALTGGSVTEAVTTALRERLRQVTEDDVYERRLAAARRIGADAASRWPEHLRHGDPTEMLYDENGLPG